MKRQNRAKRDLAAVATLRELLLTCKTHFTSEKQNAFQFTPLCRCVLVEHCPPRGSQVGANRVSSLRSSINLVAMVMMQIRILKL
jgi:hypothetical protein